jgi:hypothetical protein
MIADSGRVRRRAACDPSLHRAADGRRLRQRSTLLRGCDSKGNLSTPVALDPSDDAGDCADVPGPSVTS